MKYLYSIILLLCVMFILGSCSEDSYSLSSLEVSNNAEFSYVISQENPFTVQFNNESQNYNASYWRFGDDSGFSTEDSPIHTFPNGGIFEVILAVQGKNSGGEVRQTIEIIDPTLQGERLSDNTFQDEDRWNIQEAGYDIVTEVTFDNNGLNFSNAGDGVTTNAVVWQEIQVEAGKEYSFAANVSGGGMNQAWLEFHFSNEEPAGDDYSENNLWSLNTYAGCGINSFNGNVVDLSCNGNGDDDGTFVFEEGGMAYFVIKSGSYEGGLGPNGITVSNVSIVPIDD